MKRNHRAKLTNYVISPGFHKQAFHGQAAEFSCPGFHDKQQNSLPMHCNDFGYNVKHSDSIEKKLLMDIYVEKT